MNDYSEEWHKGYQAGLYSGITNERKRIIKLLEDLLNDPAQINLAGAIIKIKEGNK